VDFFGELFAAAVEAVGVDRAREAFVAAEFHFSFYVPNFLLNAHD